MTRPIFVELLTPRMDEGDIERALAVFAERYRTVMELGCIVSVPDNPMGTPRFQLVEVLEELQLPVEPEQVLMHLNTFHTRPALDEILDRARKVGIRRILAVSGDGGPRLTRLKPEEIGLALPTVTSVELLRYIAAQHPASFTFAVAFNPYEPIVYELEKMRHKVEAGAACIITQPIIGRHENVALLAQFGVPIVLGAWMSRRLHLLADCIGREIAAGATYDPVANLKQLRENYPTAGLYLALLNFKSHLHLVRELIQA